MVHIFQYLDLKSLCRCAQVNKKWYETTLDSCLYNSLSLKVQCAITNILHTYYSVLQKYWHKIEDHLLLNYFTLRCKGLRKLDLSWCGKDKRLTEDAFVWYVYALFSVLLIELCYNYSFLKNRGKYLTHLSLGYCDFVNKNALEEIAKCSELVGMLWLEMFTLISTRFFFFFCRFAIEELSRRWLGLFRSFLVT